MKVIIYSVNLGKYDRFRDSEHIRDLEAYYITDTLYPDSNWQYMLVHEDGDMKRRAGRYKVNSHHMPEHDISVYIDASLELTRSLNPLLIHFIQSEADVAIPRHPRRRCTYEEARVCKSKGLDSPKVIDAHMKRYRGDGFPPNYGMVATPLILRRNNAKVKIFNQTWHDEIVRGSRRDQLSVMYASWNTGVKIDELALNIYDNKYFRKHKHHEHAS